MKEVTINVKIDCDTVKKLKKCAKTEGRAVCRQAAEIIKKAVNS